MDARVDAIANYCCNTLKVCLKLYDKKHSIYLHLPRPFLSPIILYIATAAGNFVAPCMLWLQAARNSWLGRRKSLDWTSVLNW